MPAIKSTSAANFANSSQHELKPAESAINGVISLKDIPGFGKSGMTLMRLRKAEFTRES
jgi:hypothetical protein